MTTIDQLTQDLATAQAEIKDLTKYKDWLPDTESMRELKAQAQDNSLAGKGVYIAALERHAIEAQSEIAIYREALHKINEKVTGEAYLRWGNDSLTTSKRLVIANLCGEALSPPSPSLQEYRNKVIEECAKLAERMPLLNDELHAYRWSDDGKAMAWDIQHAIRGLKS